MSTPPLSILFLWHQHQPFYKDPVANRYELPWVRLHATKDYYDMAAILDEFPTIRLTINLVPSLILQLEDYAQGKAQDRFLELSRRKASELTDEERLFLLQNFFMANWENMIDVYPRYRELLDKRGRSGMGEYLSRSINYFKEQDWRDLQTWFNLAWMDPMWKEQDPFIRQLFEKGRGFSETEKNRLLDTQLAICGKVVAKHRELLDRGQIELTTTPFYHPILPLLCDTDASRVAMADVTLPANRFRHPEDARLQIERALAFHEQRFGRRPQGMWPSEGSVSPEMVRLVMEQGIRWMASDESVLARSMHPAVFEREDLYEPYRVREGDRELLMFFRDHELSDAIGFVYASWDPKVAVKDFITKLEGIHTRLQLRDGKFPRPHIVPIILDGENCWEYYQEDGRPFLRELYRQLSVHPTLKTVRASDYADESGSGARTLPSLWSGSWINSNFAIWIGHREDNRAWDLLHRTRQFLSDYLKDHPVSTELSQQAWESIYIAEGSDWCWWYGADHSSANDEMFDYLFRKQLMNVYTLFGVRVPEDLHIPIKSKRRLAPVLAPVDFITPQIDGRITNYFEWRSAGCYETEAGGTGTMHRSKNLIKAIYFGFDLQNLYVRVDFQRIPDVDFMRTVSMKLVLMKPVEREIVIRPDLVNFSAEVVELKNGVARVVGTGAMQKILEISIPMNELQAGTITGLEFFLTLEKDSLEQERWPVESPLCIPYPDPNTFSESWVV